MKQPAIAIVTPDTLTAMGLASILQRMMPSAVIDFYDHAAAVQAAAEQVHYIHYFVTSDALLTGVSFFLAHPHQTVVLIGGEEAGHIPVKLHTLNVRQPEPLLVRSLMRLAQQGHHAQGPQPLAHPQEMHPHGAATHPAMPHLTPREREVLRGVVRGCINKEIAAQMGVSLATVITHRKNLTEKLGTRSVAALTVHAVFSGVVKMEDIG